MIATACHDGHVRIFKLTPESAAHQDETPSGSQPTTPNPATGASRSSGPATGTTTTTQSSVKYRVDMVADFGDHEAPVWRVEWNAVGTVLASTGDDGRLMLWKGMCFDLSFDSYVCL